MFLILVLLLQVVAKGKVIVLVLMVMILREVVSNKVVVKSVHPPTWNLMATWKHGSANFAEFPARLEIV